MSRHSLENTTKAAKKGSRKPIKNQDIDVTLCDSAFTDLFNNLYTPAKFSFLCMRSLKKPVMRILSALLILGFIVLSLGSCKSREKCPAYGEHRAPAMQSAS
jgi:hypothetical protein